MDHDTIRKNMLAMEAWPDGVTADEKRLRGLLARRVGLTYGDDGELQSGEPAPAIDFKRDSVDDIERKLYERQVAAMAKGDARVVAHPGPELGRHDALPCDVKCMGSNGTSGTFHKGVKLGTLLDYFARRITYNNEAPVPARGDDTRVAMAAHSDSAMAGSTPAASPMICPDPSRHERIERTERAIAAASPSEVAHPSAITLNGMTACNPGTAVGISTNYGIVGEQPGVACPPETISAKFQPPPGTTQKYVAVGVEGQYAGWVFVLHADGENWTTGAKLTDMTFQMLKSRIDGAFDSVGTQDRQSPVARSEGSDRG